MTLPEHEVGLYYNSWAHTRYYLWHGSQRTRVFQIGPHKYITARPFTHKQSATKLGST